MIVAVLSGFVYALIAPLVHRFGRGNSGWIIALLPAALTVYFARFIAPVAAGENIIAVYPWASSLNADLSFRLDGLSLTFALLISGIGAFIAIYAGAYLKGHPQLGRFYIYLLMFMASMLGVVLSDNLIALFVFWELTSISSYLLIGFDHEREAARKAALQALLVTGTGGLALLAGLILLGLAGGSFAISNLAQQADAIRASHLYPAILVLVLAGAVTKSAQFPFHFWLPGAMEAPTPVSAYLHSATMVKAGIYLLARLTPVMGGTESWMAAITAFGAVTMVAGAYLSLRHTDLKRVLAYSTMSVLGTLTMLLGIGTPLAIEAAVVYLAAHSLYKGALFMVAGALDHETGTRDVTQLGGLRGSMPVTATAAGLAALSMAGLPPLFGFIGKELFYEAALHAPRAAMALTVAAVAASALLFAAAMVAGFKPFWGARLETPKAAHEGPLGLWLGPLSLAVLGLAFGLLPNLAAYLLSPAAAAVQGAPAHLELALWHGLNPALALSGLTILAGLAIYFGRGALNRLGRMFDALDAIGPSRLYELSLAGMLGLARRQTRLLQNGYLRFYLLAVLATATGLIGYVLASRAEWRWPVMLRPTFYEAVLAVVIILAAFRAARAQSRLSAIVALGAVGYAIALLFTLFGAPDLAVTQFLIETLTVILFVLVLYRLPRFAGFSSRRARRRDMVVAACVGGLMSLLVLAALVVPRSSEVSEFYAAASFPEGHGRNVVNVILVDFRGLDTLGEITVLTLAALGVYALMKLRLHKEEEEK